MTLSNLKLKHALKWYKRLKKDIINVLLLKLSEKCKYKYLLKDNIVKKKVKLY